MLDDARWEATDRILGLALELPREEREPFVRREAEDESQYQRVLDLLAASEAPATGFGALISGIAAGVVSEEPVRSVGPYRLGPLVGQGGMGAVYLAERDIGDAVQRVALKIVRPELAALTDEAALARFRQERSVVATLEHPGIARLLDAGETPEGVPYLAMEFIDGVPITAYCATLAVPIETRLRLLVEVARAVEYAHRRLVVHRDIKPGNLLVTKDAQGQPHAKLLDFGIAKLLTEESDERMPLTRTGSQPLTPEYAAPEQLLNQPITTATDVYALGVVLYELLVGHRPFAGATASELEREILESQPPRPSSSLAARALSEGHRPATMTPNTLRGDLDTICLTALRREPERRYGSAAELADDIERYLAGRPIGARPATIGYRTSKFVRRHRVGVVASLAVLVSLIGGLGVALWQADVALKQRDRATSEAARAQQATGFLAELIDLGNPFASELTVPASALADSGFARLAAKTDMDPLLRAELLVIVGGLYKGQGRYEYHERSTSEALRLLRAHDAPPLDLGLALGSHANALFDLGRPEEAIQEAEEAYTILREASAPPEALSQVGYMLGSALVQLGRSEEAVSRVGEVVEVSRQIQGPGGGPDPRLVNALVVQAQALGAAGHQSDALQAADEAIALSRSILIPGSMVEQSALFNIAEMLLRIGHYRRAESLFLGINEVDLQKLAPDHPDHANTLSMLAILALVDGRHQRAADLAAEAETVYLRVYGESRSPSVEARVTRALATYRAGDADGAERRLRATLAAASEIADDDRARIEFALAQIARGRDDAPSGAEEHPTPLSRDTQRLIRDMMGDRAVELGRDRAK